MNERGDHRALLKSAIDEIEALRAQLDALREPVAIVGIGCRLPGAEGPEAFWQRLQAGDVICDDPPPSRAEIAACYHPDPTMPGRAYVHRAAYVDGIEDFDAAFFRMLPAAAAALDPQHRMLLETSWAALEDAGIDPLSLKGSHTGVYVGLSFDDYAGRAARVPGGMDAAAALGGVRSLAAGRISYFLDLHGPCVQLDTACSSSALAIHQAVQALRHRQCDLVLAGGANALIGAEAMIQLSKLKALSPQGRCRSFEAAADGYGRGEGAVVFALRRLSDAMAAGERIHAVIHGSATNHDGASNGLTAPNGRAQEAVILAALADAGADVDAFGFIEAHGTGTPLGDPIEAAALAKIFARRGRGAIVLGSVKSTFGHAEAAAGALGVLKAALALREGALPAQAGLEQPTHRIAWDESPLRLADRPVELSSAQPLAGVSSFGFSGTNVHIVLGPPPAGHAAPSNKRLGIALLSAASEAALRRRAQQLAAQLRRDPDLAEADVERSLLARAGLRQRAAFAYPDTQTLADQLDRFARGEDVVALAVGRAERDLELPPITDFADREAAARAFVAGAQIAPGVIGQHPGRPVTFDPYPFERERHWLDLPEQAQPTAAAPAAAQPVAEVVAEGEVKDKLRALLAGVLGLAPERIGDSMPFIEIGADSLMLLDAVRLIEQRFGIAIQMGALFEGLSTLDALAAHIAAQGSAVVQPGVTPLAPVVRPSPRVAAPEPVADPPVADPTAQSRYFDDLVARYVARQAGSKARAHASRVVLADSRRVVGFRPSFKEALFPIVGVRGAGAELWDVDGNRFIDTAMGFGVHLFGHGYAPVEAAIDAARARGLSIGPQAPDAGEVAAALCALTGFERAAFCNSGTEAVMTALRLARAATGRDGVALFSGSYHGHFDGVLGAASRGATVPVTAGVAPAFVSDLLVVDYGADSALEAIAANADRLAAILVEPVQSRHPDLQPSAFLQQLRALADRHGIALIFDEVLTGLRVHPAGAQALLGVKPDLATYGKILGGGLPIGAVAGGRRFLDGIDGGSWDYGDASAPSADRVFFGGTFNKNALSMAAARAVLAELGRAGPALQAELNARTAAMVARLEEAFAAEQFPVAVHHFGSLFRFAFSQNPDAFYLEMACRGVYVWEGRNCFLSTAHDDAAIDHIVESAIDSLRAMRAGGLLDAAPPPKSAHASPAHAPIRPRPMIAPAPLVAKVMQQGVPEIGLAHQERTCCLDAAATVYARAALKVLGAPDEGAPLRVQAQLGAFASWLAADGDDQPVVSVAAMLERARQLGGEAEAALLQSAGEALADVLSGVRHPLDALAPGGDFTLLSDIYVRPELAGATNRLFADTIAAMADGMAADQPLDILEIGAGTGSATGALLDALGQRPLRYHATDLSLAFFDPARWRYAADTRLSYGVYDINREVAAQGLGDKRFDLIIASNALHVADDLRFSLGEVASLLKPNGMLVLNELTAAPRWLQLVFGLTEGWWRHYDGLRIAHAPLLTAEGWRQAIRAQGLPLVEAVTPDGMGDAPAAAIIIAQKRQVVEPSRAQQQLHALAELDPAGARAYNLTIGLELDGALESERLANAIVAEALRHDALNMVFAEDGGLVPGAARPAECAIVDLHASPDPAAAARAWRRDFADAPFDLATGPLLRAAILELGGGRRQVVLAVPHIVGDAISLGLLWNGAVRGFAGASPAPAPSFADHLAAQRTWLAGEEAKRCRAFWQARQMPEPERSAPEEKDWSGGNVRRRIGTKLTGDLQARAAAAGLTPFMFSFAAFALLMSRSLGEQQLTIGVPVSGRRRAAEGLVGYCTHLLPVTIRILPQFTLGDYLAAVRAALVEAYAHQDLPFAEMDAGRIDYTFNLDMADVAAPDGMTARLLSPDTEFEPFPLRVNLTADAEGLVVDAGYQQARFDRDQVDRMLERYHVLLRSFEAAEADRRLCDLDHLTAADGRKARALMAAPGATASELCLTRFLAVADRQPDAVAIRWQGQETSYAELVTRAQAIARLVATAADPGRLVAVEMPRQPDAIAAFLGIMLAGCAYLPVDPDAPSTRREALLAEARPALRIAMCPGTDDRLPTLRLDQPLPDATADLPVLTADMLAYVIATSGSTGAPKLVGTEHCALAAYLGSAHTNRTLSARRLVAATSPFTFDVSIFEIYGTLTTGGTILLLEDVAALLDIGEDVPTTISGVPTVLAAIDLPSGIEDVGFGGEALPQALADRTTARPEIRVRNVYGPTETTCYCLEAILQAGEPVTLGTPLPHISAYVLDAALHPVGIGEAGEIYIAGPSLARGYLGQPGLTARGFLPDPFGTPGSRMYRTGDRGMITPGGTVHYFGRRDSQVKLNGIRAEMGEIEAALLAATGLGVGAIAAAVASGSDGRTKLVAFTTASLELEALRAALAPLLPPALQPSALVHLDALPLNPNEKLDRKRLALLAGEALAAVPAVPSSAPMTVEEARIAAALATALGIAEVGPDDDFFALGGDSIVSLQAAAAARRAGFALDPKIVLIHRTVRAIAQHAAPAAVAAPPRQAVSAGVELAPEEHAAILSLFEDSEPAE